jgi:transposase InsO family protein
MLGISKQAVHKHNKGEDEYLNQISDLIIQVDELRKEHPGCGVEKMYNTLKPDFIGRDKFIEVFMNLGYRVKRVKNYVRTTIPTHLKYPNLIEGMLIHKPNQVWQSDITYFHLNGKFYYIVFIIDVYTRNIVGYKVSDNMRAEANISALTQALKREKEPLTGLIHHSDRGSQYVDKNYLKLLQDNGIAVSMGMKAQDNVYAERINGTIKNEYLHKWEIKSFKDLQIKVKKAVTHYNEKRKHDSLPEKCSPMDFKKSLLSLYRQKRPTVIIYAEGKNKPFEPSRLIWFMPEKEPLAHICPMS